MSLTPKLPVSGGIGENNAAKRITAFARGSVDWRCSLQCATPNRSKKLDEQILISFGEILFVSRALETTKGGCALSS
jgi:hypothetical protein